MLEVSRPRSADDFALVENGAIAGRYLARFWQPIAISHDYAPGVAKRIKMLGNFFSSTGVRTTRSTSCKTGVRTGGPVLHTAGWKATASAAAITAGSSRPKARALIFRPRAPTTPGPSASRPIRSGNTWGLSSRISATANRRNFSAFPNSRTRAPGSCSRWPSFSRTLLPARRKRRRRSPHSLHS